MPGKYLLDTPIVIAILTQESEVQARLQKESEVFIPSTVLGELYYGALKSGRPEANIARLEEFASVNEILDCNSATAYEYGVIKCQLRAKGRPIPENDIWIAAIAKQHGLILVSRDEHFKEIDNFEYEQW